MSQRGRAPGGPAPPRRADRARADSLGRDETAAPSKRLLWVTPKWPLPAQDGARQATTQLLRGLCSRGAVVDLLAIVPDGEEVSEHEAVELLGVASARVVRRPKSGPLRHIWNLCRHPSRAVTLAQYNARGLSERIGEAVTEHEAVVVFDGLHAAAWLLEVDTWPNAKFIYRAHNVEADLWFRGASQRKGAVAWFLEWQGLAVQEFETRLCLTAQRVLTVSDEDAKRFRSNAGAVSVQTLPIGMEPKPQREDLADGAELLFIGRLDWPPNRDGLRWFLDEVWPNVTRPFTLHVVGSGDGGWLEPYLSDSRIHFHGRVEDVTPYYHAAIVNIVPIFYGSGTRVKVIESSLFATACLGTEQGVEGLGLDPACDYFRAESDAEWIDALNALDPQAARERGQSALERVAEHYDRDRVAAQFIDTLREL